MIKNYLKNARRNFWKISVYVFVSILLITLTCFQVSGQALTGNFEGAFTRDGAIQFLSVSFKNVNGKLEANFTIPEIGYNDVKSEAIFFKGDTLNLKLFYGNFYCFIDKSQNEITGISEKWNPKIRIDLKRTLQKPLPFSEEAVRFSNGDVSLEGTVLKPNIRGKIPYVVLIHGSGDQERTTPYYHSLAYNLVSRGIGVLFYDKRGCGKSNGNFNTASFSDLADDAVSALNFLKKNHRFQLSKAGFIGTSQGGWIAPIAANKIKDCAFVILNVGPSVSVFEQDVDRVKYSMKGDGMSDAAIDSAVNYTKLFFQYVVSNKENDWDELEKNAELIKKKEWRQYINIPKDKNDFAWWRANNYDPEPILSSIKCPVLSLMGELDPLVPPAENKEKMEAYLSKSGVRHQVLIIPGCAHDMLTFQGLNGDNWNWPKVHWQWRSQPPEFMESIVNFIINTDKP